MSSSDASEYIYYIFKKNENTSSGKELTLISIYLSADTAHASLLSIMAVWVLKSTFLPGQ